LFGGRDPHGQLHRWSAKLAEYDFGTVHRPGREQTSADVLSRSPVPGAEATDRAAGIARIEGGGVPTAAHTAPVLFDGEGEQEAPVELAECCKVLLYQVTVQEPGEQEVDLNKPPDDVAHDWSYAGECACQQRDDPALCGTVNYLEKGATPAGLPDKDVVVLSWRLRTATSQRVVSC